MAHEHGELRVEDILEAGDRFGRRLAIAIVVTTLAAALVAYLQAGSVFRHDEAVSRADQWAALSAGARDLGDQAAQLEITRARLAQRHRLRAEQVLAQRILGNPTDVPALTAQYTTEQQIADQITSTSIRIAHAVDQESTQVEAMAAAAEPNVDPSLATRSSCRGVPPSSPRAPPPIPATVNPDQSASLMATYLASPRRESYRFDALREGASQAAENAEKQFTRYAVSLAYFAVAVFLFGYALTPFGRRYRRAYATVGIIFGLGSSAWALYTNAQQSTPLPPAAAAAYADGRVAFESLRYADAINLLTCAIDRSNGAYPTAYVYRARARLLLGSPQQETSIIAQGLIDPKLEQAALSDEQRAQLAAAEDPQFLKALAADVFATALHRADPGGLVRALQLDERAQSAQQWSADNVFDRGTALLALGRPWQAVYAAAEALPAFRSQSVGYADATLTGLEFVGQAFPQRWPQVDAAKQQVIGAASALYPHSADGSPLSAGSRTPIDDGPAHPVGALTHVAIDVTPGAGEFSFTAPAGFDASRDRLFAAWYARTRQGWATQHTSGPVDSLLALGHRRFEGIATPSTRIGACPAGGQYMLELYVNGHLPRGGTAAASVRFPPLKHEFIADLNIDLCVPSGWRELPHALTGVADGFGDPAGRAGVVVFDVSSLAAAGLGRDAQVRRVQTRFARLLPRCTTPPVQWPVSFVAALAYPAVTGCSDPTGALLVGTGTTSSSGRSYVVAGFGPGRASAAARPGPPSLIDSIYFGMTSRE